MALFICWNGGTQQPQNPFHEWDLKLKNFFSSPSKPQTQTTLKNDKWLMHANECWMWWNFLVWRYWKWWHMKMMKLARWWWMLRLNGRRVTCWQGWLFCNNLFVNLIGDASSPLLKRRWLNPHYTWWWHYLNLLVHFTMAHLQPVKIFQCDVKQYCLKKKIVATNCFKYY